MSALTRITIDGIDRRIAEFRTVLDRTTSNLVELDADVTRQLLESSTSLGHVTAAAWADASQRHAELWRGQFALEGALTRIAEARGARKSLPQPTLISLDELLGAACVEVPRSPGDGRRRLTEGPAPTTSMTIEEALRHMSEDYEVVAQLVAAVADVWGGPTEQLGQLAHELADLERRLDDHGVRRPNELQTMVRAVAEAEGLARNDPLALDLATVPELQACVTRLRTTLDDTLRGRQTRLADLASTERGIALGRVAMKSCREQLEQGAQKVLVPDEMWAALEGAAREFDRLQSKVELARQPGAEDGCGALPARAEELMDDVSRIAATVETRLRARDELRGVLTAYHAKAQALGLGEDIELGELYSAAREILYAAPCDLGLAEQRVFGYQRAIRPGSWQAS